MDMAQQLQQSTSAACLDLYARSVCAECHRCADTGAGYLHSCTRARPALYGSGPAMKLVPCVRHGLRVRFCMPGNKRTHVPLVPRALVTRVACCTC